MKGGLRTLPAMFVEFSLQARRGTGRRGGLTANLSSGRNRNFAQDPELRANDLEFVAAAAAAAAVGSLTSPMKIVW